jgi:hypothetical protein
MITRESILARKLPQDEIDIPEWGGRVICRALSAGEYMAMMKCLAADPAKDDPNTIVYHLIVRSVFNEQGDRLFNDDDAAFVRDQMGTAIVQQLTTAVTKFLPDREAAAKN